MGLVGLIGRYGAKLRIFGATEKNSCVVLSGS